MFLSLKQKLYITVNIYSTKTNALILKEVIDMSWKMFGKEGKLVSVTQEVFKLVRLIAVSGKEDSNISSPSPTFTVAPSKSVRSIKNYSLGADLKKGQALAYPLMEQNRPK